MAYMDQAIPFTIPYKYLVNAAAEVNIDDWKAFCEKELSDAAAAIFPSRHRSTKSIPDTSEVQSLSFQKPEQLPRL